MIRLSNGTTIALLWSSVLAHSPRMSHVVRRVQQCDHFCHTVRHIWDIRLVLRSLTAYAVSPYPRILDWLSLQSLICIHYALSLFSAQYIFSCIDIRPIYSTMRCYYKLYDCILVWQVAPRMSRNSYEYMSMPPQKINNCLKNGGDSPTKFLHFFHYF